MPPMIDGSTRTDKLDFAFERRLYLVGEPDDFCSPIALANVTSTRRQPKYASRSLSYSSAISATDTPSDYAC